MKRKQNIRHRYLQGILARYSAIELLMREFSMTYEDAEKFLD